MNEEDTEVRKRKNASINVAMDLVRNNKAEAVYSAGNSGAMMASAIFRIGRLKGIDRPAIGALFPTRDQTRPVLVLDVGANTDCKPSYLHQFALLGNIYAKDVLQVKKPKIGELLFIPQKPYMLLGSLREQLCYPTEVKKFSDEHLTSVLHEVNLRTLVDRYPNLDIKQDWPRILSLGEQQRLAFARLLLNSPRFAVLDEATSALDINTEKKLYSLLKERELSLISVGHRPSLKDFHENILELNGQGDWKLLTSDKYNFKD